MFVLNTAVEMLLLLLQFLHDFDLILFADLHSWSEKEDCGDYFCATLLLRISFLAVGNRVSRERERLIFI